MGANLGKWSYVVFTLAALGVMSLWRDGWDLYYRVTLNKRCKVAYDKVSYIHRPEMLNPARPGNAGFMREDARRAVADVLPLINKLSLTHPDTINTDDASSIEAWYSYLQPLARKDY